jgi:ketosteroid isomerase-like protein
MRAKIGIAVVISALTIIAVARHFGMSRALASDDGSKAQIAALENRLVDAYTKMDVKAAMAFYVDDKETVFFEDTLPFQLKGLESLRNYNEGFYKNLKVTQFHPRLEAMSIVVSGDLAAAHFILPIKWTDKNGSHLERGRGTHIFKKIDGKWLIWHEHFSVPFDPATGKAVLDATP